MRAPSFLDILTEKIRDDLRAEIQAEVEARLSYAANPEPPPAASDVESWLLTHTGKTFFARAGAAKKAYTSAPRTRPAPPPPPPKRERRAARATTTEQIFAFEFLVRHANDKDVDINAFTESELKALWRQAALNTHPDRNVDSDGQVFAEITEAYNSLRTLFKD